MRKSYTFDLLYTKACSNTLTARVDKRHIYIWIYSVLYGVTQSEHLLRDAMSRDIKVVGVGDDIIDGGGLTLVRSLVFNCHMLSTLPSSIIHQNFICCRQIGYAFTLLIVWMHFCSTATVHRFSLSLSPAYSLCIKQLKFQLKVKGQYLFAIFFSLSTLKYDVFSFVYAILHHLNIETDYWPMKQKKGSQPIGWITF